KASQNDHGKGAGQKVHVSLACHYFVIKLKSLCLCSNSGVILLLSEFDLLGHQSDCVFSAIDAIVKFNIFPLKIRGLPESAGLEVKFRQTQVRMKPCFGKGIVAFRQPHSLMHQWFSSQSLIPIQINICKKVNIVGNHSLIVQQFSMLK